MVNRLNQPSCLCCSNSVLESIEDYPFVVVFGIMAAYAIGLKYWLHNTVGNISGVALAAVKLFLGVEGAAPTWPQKAYNCDCK